MPFSWSIPANIPKPDGVVAPLIPWERLKFNPIGLLNLRRHLHAHPTESDIFKRYENRFIASDVAWFSAGLSNDGHHQTRTDSFHSLFDELRQNVPKTSEGKQQRRDLQMKVQNLAFDIATLWDRAFGGCTMVLHVDGTTNPGTPALPEFIKAHVYLPPNLVEEFPDVDEPISSIVQSFIENLGVPTVMRWKRAGLKRGWNLGTSAQPYNPPQITPLGIPSPTTPLSAHYVFHGRPYGLTASHDHPSTSSNHLSNVSGNGIAPDADQDMFGELDASACQLLDATEKIDRLESELGEMVEREARMVAECAAANFTILSLRQEMQMLIGRLRVRDGEAAQHSIGVACSSE